MLFSKNKAALFLFVVTLVEIGLIFISIVLFYSLHDQLLDVTMNKPGTLYQVASEAEKAKRRDDAVFWMFFSLFICGYIFIFSWLGRLLYSTVGRWKGVGITFTIIEMPVCFIGAIFSMIYLDVYGNLLFIPMAFCLASLIGIAEVKRF